MNNKEIELLGKKFEEDIINWRRYLHEHPELSMHEVETAQFIYEKLLSFSTDLLVQRPTQTSVIARLKGRKPGKVLALRADIDALPIEEQTDLTFRSTRKGVMHACGHDGHTAMLLGAVRILVELQDKLHGEVVFIFQHAEELASGADEILNTGVLKDVDCILGGHLYNQVPVGQFGLALGRMMSASDGFDIMITGKGGHAAEPDQAQDLIYLGTEIVQSFSQLIARQVNANDQAIISVTKFNAGSANNVLPDQVQIGGCTRTFSDTTREFILHQIQEIVETLSTLYGAKGTIEWTKGATAVINHSEVTDAVRAVIENNFGKDAVHILSPHMISEDFGSYLKEIPGNFLFIGSGNPKEGITYPLHHPKFTFDEQALLNGTLLHVMTALTLPRALDDITMK
ncbi:M20 metallopeptidase family protein [Peribacillus butanolivorans]|uniref:M20 metallopeptidase family protein n=1 Tax=Peribacillus butanolivorans TaxID=421767 RepID=UPI0035D9667B